MRHEFWEDKWKANDIQFHLPEVNPLLVKYFSSLPKGKVLVPLCGKSLDMKWLLSQGHEVVGVELSHIACKAFFTENNLSVSVVEKGLFTVYKGDNVEIWCGDIFQLPMEECAKLTAIYDRAALVALPEEMRLSYVEFIKKLVKTLAHADILLITVEYAQNLVQGPPFSITDTMVEEFYTDTFTINKLQLPDEYINALKQNSKFQKIAVEEHVYWLKYPKLMFGN